MMQNGVSALYNCSTSSANVAYFKKFNGVKKLLAIFNTPSERLNMSVLFALSYLIEEKDNHLIMANNGELLFGCSLMSNLLLWRPIDPL